MDNKEKEENNENEENTVARLTCDRYRSITVICTTVGMMVGLLIVPWQPMASIVVPPIHGSNTYVWQVNPRCDNTSIQYNSSIAFLSQFIDFTSYSTGCGAVGDSVSLASNHGQREHPPQYDAENHQNLVFWLPVGIGIAAFAVIALIVCACWCPKWDVYGDGARKAEKDSIMLRQWTMMASILILFLITAAQTLRWYLSTYVWPQIWLCRPYRVIWNEFGDLVDFYVTNTSPDRGSSPITSVDDWNTLEHIALTECVAVTLRILSGGNRSFKIDFEPSAEVQTLIDQATRECFRRLYWWLIGTSLHGIFVMIFINCRRQKDRAAQDQCESNIEMTVAKAGATA